MTPRTDSAIRVRVDPTNPGQFFGCCGLLELADRLWGGVQARFEGDLFLLDLGAIPIAERSPLELLLEATTSASLLALDPEDEFEPPLKVGEPFNMHLDWWQDTHSGGRALKVWAGSMRGFRIARAMRHVLQDPGLHRESLFDHAAVVFDPAEPEKKVEPFYFDARRGSSARSIDLGFSADALGITTAAYPAVEFLCLVGLQRFRPRPTAIARVLEYYAWAEPLDARLAAVAGCGALPVVPSDGYRFDIVFRTDQRKHKAFGPATPLERRRQ